MKSLLHEAILFNLWKFLWFSVTFFTSLFHCWHVYIFLDAIGTKHYVFLSLLTTVIKKNAQKNLYGTYSPATQHYYSQWHQSVLSWSVTKISKIHILVQNNQKAIASTCANILDIIQYFNRKSVIFLSLQCHQITCLKVLKNSEEVPIKSYSWKVRYVLEYKVWLNLRLPR